MSWKEIKHESGRAQTGGIWEPMPVGPYLVIDQHDHHKLENAVWATVSGIGANGAAMIQIIPDQFFGKAIYANVEGKAMMVAFHWDSSD